MKPTPAAVLDARTPGWPVVEATLTDPPTVTVGGISTPLDGADPQRDLVLAAAAQARGNGRPIRARVATPGGDVHHLIVTTTGRVVPLPHPTSDRPGKKARSGKARAGANTAPAAPPAQRARRAGRPGRGWGRFPRPVRWAALALAVLTAAALVVIVGHGGDAPAASAADPAVAAPVPPAGRLYTQLGPPGWSQQAAWVLPITAGAVPVTDPVTGVTVAVTPTDRSTPDTAAQRVGPRDRWLSVLEPDGRTRYAAPLDGAPRFGPVITRIDGTTVALIADTDRIRYWPLTGGPDTAVDLPTGGKLTATPGGSVLLTLPGDRVGYLHHGAVHTVQVLPRTSPAAALDDGAVLATQPGTGAWWTLRDDTPPTAVTPTAPPGAGALHTVLAVTATRVLLTWTTAAPDTTRGNAAVIVAGYDRATGRLLATATAPATALTRPAAVVGNDPAGLTAAGPVLLQTPATGPATVTVAAGFTATAAADHVYGTVNGRPAVLTTTGAPAVLPDGTLTPTGTGGQFLPVLSQGRLYALLPAGPT